MARDIDALTSSTLKHLRERWWDAAFTQFLRDNLQPRAGNRILDVGCGVGTAEITLGRLHLSQMELYAVDVLPDRVREARVAVQARNVRAGLAAADARALPFGNAVFDSAFCVAVLQHVGELSQALAEMARVTRPGGRILVVEPDNTARYWYSSTDSGLRAFEMALQFFAAVSEARGDASDPAPGPHLPGLFARHGIEPLAVHLFPVSVARLGAPPESVWQARRETIAGIVEKVPDGSIRRLGLDYLKVLDRYAGEATAVGPSFVEIQNTMLFATVGQRAVE